MYTEAELDSLFFLFTFITFDKQFSSFNLKIQTQLLFQSISDTYKHRSIWTLAKLTTFCTRMLHILAVDKSKSDLSLEALNNLYHRMVNLNNYFKVSHNTFLRILASDLAFNCLIDLLDRTNTHQFMSLNDNSNVISSFFYYINKPRWDKTETIRLIYSIISQF